MIETLLKWVRSKFHAERHLCICGDWATAEILGTDLEGYDRYLCERHLNMLAKRVRRVRLGETRAIVRGA